MLDLPMASPFQDVEKRDQIGLRVHMRVVDGVAHTWLRCQMQNALGTPRAQGLFNSMAVDQIGFDETKVGLTHQAVHARLLERHIVIGGVVVNAHHFVTTGQQVVCSVHANETGATGEQDFHGVTCEVWSSQACNETRPV